MFKGSSLAIEEAKIEDAWAQLPRPMKSSEVGDSSETRYEVEEAGAEAVPDTLKFFTQKKEEKRIR